MIANMFAFYVFGLWPVFTFLIVRETRKLEDVDVGMFFLFIILGLLPFAREAVYFYVLKPSWLKKTLWKKVI